MLDRQLARLKEKHRTLERWLARAATKLPEEMETRTSLAREILERVCQLIEHEEEILYSALRRRFGDESTRDRSVRRTCAIYEAQHNYVLDLSRRLIVARDRDAFVSGLRSLSTALRYHHDEEERHVFKLRRSSNPLAEGDMSSSHLHPM